MQKALDKKLKKLRPKRGKIDPQKLSWPKPIEKKILNPRLEELFNKSIDRNLDMYFRY